MNRPATIEEGPHIAEPVDEQTPHVAETEHNLTTRQRLANLLGLHAPDSIEQDQDLDDPRPSYHPRLEEFVDEIGNEPSISFITRLNAWCHKTFPLTSYEAPSQSNAAQAGTQSTQQRIDNFNKNAGRIKDRPLNASPSTRMGHEPQKFNVSQVEQYQLPVSDTRIFDSIFPLGRIYNRFKDGIRIFVKTKFSRQKPDRRTNAALDLAISNLLEAKIISESKKCSFSSNIFLISKIGGKVRPVINLWSSSIFVLFRRHYSKPKCCSGYLPESIL